MIFLPLFLVFLTFPHTEACVKPTSTSAPPVESCTSCTQAQIEPVSMNPGTKLGYELLNSPGQCVAAMVTCQTSDGRICAQISVKEGDRVYTTATFSSSARVVFYCKDNGQFMYDAAREVGHVECEFSGCD